MNIDGDLTFGQGKTATLPSGTVTNAMMNAAGAGLYVAATKLEHQFAVFHAVKATANVATETMPVHIVQGGTGEIVAFEVFPITAPTGSDSYTVDLHKSTGAGAFATVLSAVVTMNSSDTDRTLNAATISAADLVDGDCLEVVIAIGSNTTGKGVVCTVTLREDPST